MMSAGSVVCSRLTKQTNLIDYVWDTVFAYSNPARPVGA